MFLVRISKERILKTSTRVSAKPLTDRLLYQNDLYLEEIDIGNVENAI
jgi:hypothetical protein